MLAERQVTESRAIAHESREVYRLLMMIVELQVELCGCAAPLCSCITIRARQHRELAGETPALEVTSGEEQLEDLLHDQATLLTEQSAAVSAH